MKPFDLKAALKGAKVVTRDGRPVKIAGYNPDAHDCNYIWGWVENVSCSWLADGCYHGKFDMGSRHDLFMAPTERKEWIVVVSGGITTHVLSNTFASIEQAEKCVMLIANKATIHEITIIE